MDLNEIIAKIIRDVAELPDRTSPEDWPDAMLVEPVELNDILVSHLDGLKPVVKRGLAELSKDSIDYPRDIFMALIHGNSPYAFYLFQWVPYQTDAKKWRLKMQHDVKTFDGREAHGIWPNGNHCGPFTDDEVEFIRISKDQCGTLYVDPRIPKQAEDKS